MDFNGNEIGDEVIESDEKKKNIFDSRNYFEKKKRIVKQWAVNNAQQDAGKAFDEMEKVECLAESLLFCLFKGWLWVVWELVEMVRIL